MQSPRSPEVDAVRATLAFGVVVFHALRVFDGLDFYVKAHPPADQLGAVVLFCALWGMPLLFALAGWSLWWSLGARTIAGVMRERAKRLLVPFALGLVVLVPPQKHLEALAAGEHVSYGTTLARFFDVHLVARFPLPVDGPWFELAHLWFLLYLFGFTLLLAPALGRLRPRLGALLLLVVAIEALLGAEDAGGWNRWAYPMFLLAGFATAARPALAVRLAGLRWRCTVAGTVAFLPLAATGVLMHDRVGDALMTSLAPGPVAWRAAEAAVGCLWVAAGLGHLFAWIRRGSFRPSGRGARVLRWGAAVGLPVYVLHQTVVVALAYVVVRWPVPRTVQFAAIALGALVASTLLAEGMRRVMEPKTGAARIGSG